MEQQVICRGCPRRCSVLRPQSCLPGTAAGACRCGLLPVLARAAAHFGEEPCISGTRGSGAVFFSGCALKCVFCQNMQISRGCFGREVSVSDLRKIFLRLIDEGVHNINLVNPTHFTAAIAQALDEPLPVPVVYNCGGYESVEALAQLEGKVQVYLPDYKYADREPAARYSAAADYPTVAAAAIKEMYRQTGPYVLDGQGIMQRGVLIRHLVLPGSWDNTRHVIDWLTENFAPGEVMFSLMGQYTPCGDLQRWPELTEPLCNAEYADAAAYLLERGWRDGYLQEPDASGCEHIPAFDLTGVLP